MQGDGSEASLREMATRCRLLAASVTDESTAVSLRKLAIEYDEAADAADQRNGFHLNQPPGGHTA
jgi:hypothetical protein